MIVTPVPPMNPGVSLTLDGKEASLLMEAINEVSVGYDRLGEFASDIYGHLKRLGVKLPQGHPHRGHE